MVEEDQRLHAQHGGDQRLAVIARGERGEQELGQRQRAVEQQQQAEHLADAPVVDPVGLDQRGGEAWPLRKASAVSTTWVIA